MTRSILLATAVAAALVAAPAGGAVAQSQPEQSRPEARDGRSDRLDSAKQELRLTPEQEQLWGRVDEALRSLRERARTARGAGPPAGDAMERLRWRADRVAARAETLRQLADAVQPLWSLLSEDQKRELTGLIRDTAAGDARVTRRDRDDDRGMRRWGSDDRGPRGRMMGGYPYRDYDEMYRRHHGRDWDDDRGWRRGDRDDRRGRGWRDDDEGVSRYERGRDDRDRRDRWGDRRGWRDQDGYGKGDRFDSRRRDRDDRDDDDDRD
ncbi:MAG: Spy/CpxP family protein refolding chaperone [Xanthobacteraceae bacterium]|nr:Spy/CpxP family protein refolding chaperone [Xanthobacteraceae bacterium]